jgi:uncharacterized protein (DUF1697 family)
VARFVALLRAVNVGGRTVAMPTARDVLKELGFDQVSSYANSGKPPVQRYGDRVR